MQIFDVQAYNGRNIYSHRPVIRMLVDLGDFSTKKTNDIADFNENILKAFPGLGKHRCSLGFEGGFALRLKEGTYLGHVIEHLSLELQNIIGYGVRYGRARVVSEPRIYYIVYEFINERCGIECGREAFNFVHAIARGELPDMDGIVEGIRKITAEYELGPSTKAIYDEAKKRGIPVTRIGNESLLQLGCGKYARFVEASLTDAPSCISVDIASNKHLTKELLRDNKIPVPCGDIAYSRAGALAAVRNIGYPVVVKPFNGSQGRGVTVCVRDDDELAAAFDEAVKYGKAVILERFVNGNDYRILVVGERVSAVSERTPPYVVGDGTHTVSELVETLNASPLRGEDHEKPLTRIKLDDSARKILQRYGLAEGSIPETGRTVRLRDNGNLSTGGTARDCTNEIHPYNADIAVKAAKAVGLDIAGIDMIACDISKPINQTGGAIIEVNAAPGLRMHLFPSVGRPVNVAADIMDMMFPAGHPCTIPIVSITGTNGKTTTTRLIRHTVSLTGKKVGMTSTSGVYIGDKCILKGDNTGPVSAKMVLSNREVEVAVLETARGGIVKKGLGYDLADVGVVVNIADDHLGLDGIETLEDLAGAKSLVIEAVKPDGFSVLNADDMMTSYLQKRASGKIIFFSSTNTNPLLLSHIRSGGRAVYIENDGIVIFGDKKKTRLMRLEEIPITFGGMVDCNIENSLAAVSALYAMNVPVSTIRQGLRTFKPDAVLNPGRFNIFDMGDFKVMLDYSHNPSGYNAVAGFIRKISAGRLVGIIGVPGDRLDRNIAEVGEICAKAFTRLYIKEDNDLRGRKPGEVAQILFDAAVEAGLGKEDISVIYSELKALETAILDAQPGDLIVMFYEEFEPAVELVKSMKQELERSLMKQAVEMKETVG